MKPRAFDYVAAASLEEAVAGLAAAKGEARLLAGGQTLGPMLNLRLVAPACLVDVGRIAALRRIADNGARLVIGAGVTHAMLEDRSDPSPTVRLMCHVASAIAYRAIRNRGTLGGSLAHADPAADWIAAMTLLDAELAVLGPGGRRTLAMRDFMTGAFATALEPAEAIEAVALEKLSPSARWGYCRIARKVGEFPDAIGAVVVDPARALCRIVVGALDAPPALLAALADQVAREGAQAAAAERVREAVAEAAPGLDPVHLRLHAAAVRRAILQALAP